ncbi:unnamed protein product, partial [Effrenium voratum]
MIELKKLYSLRTAGTTFVLRCWRLRLNSLFCFQVIVMMWLRYTVDLGMDIQAMGIFLQHKQPWFFILNLLGVFLGLLWTAYEFYMVITAPNSKITSTEIFFSGLTLPLLGQHVTFLALLSLWRGELHPFLFVSTLAEAILESSFSSFIQTYAVVFTELTWIQRSQLYISVFMSFVSIGYAFSTIDMFQGGRMLVKIPGFCKSFNGRFCVVFVFRVAEITSRATSLALFQAVTRPYGMFVLIAADGLVMSCVTMFFQCRVGKFAPGDRIAFVRQNFFYVIPSVLCCRMAPMLEKDSVITMPPIVYYSIRFLELAGMVAVAGKWLDWDLQAMRSHFEDDGFIVAGFAVSTVLMLVLVVLIRTTLSVRCLMDSPAEVWSENEFNNVQHALKNRILEAHIPDPKAMRIVSKVLEHHPKFTSSECFGPAREAGLPSCNWDSTFLRARVIYNIKKAMLALEGYDFSKAKKRSRSSLQTGGLVSIRCSAGHLTTKCDQIVGQLSNDLSNQKFVLESTDPHIQELLISGQPIRLRALESGQLLGLEKEGDGSFSLRSRAAWTEEEATSFSVALVHEEIYRSASRFSQFVHMGDDLEVDELRLVKRRGQNLKGWDSSGWTVLAINGQKATREEVDDILAKAGKATKYAKMMSSVSGGSDGDSNLELSSLKPGEEAAARGEYIVQFVRTDKETPVVAGSKVFLHHAGGWTSAPMGMAQGLDAEDEVSRPRFVEGEFGLTFALERAEYGSKDDESIFQWAADKISVLADTVQQQESFAEKYRTLTVVACNARTVDVEGVAGILQQDLQLHLRVLSNLLQPIRLEKDIRIEFEDLEELTMDVRFPLAVEEEEMNHPILIEAWDDEDDESHPTRAAGVQPGDELLQLELIDSDGTIKKISSPAEMRQLLIDSDEHDELAVATFRCKAHAKAEESNDTVKRAVAQTEPIATLLPTWQEITKGAKACVEQGDFENLKEAVLSRTFLFRGKCEVVESLTSAGFGLHHDDFAARCVELHRRFDPLPEPRLCEFFPGRANAELRDEVLIHQLEVLTNTWRTLPRLVKEDMPEVLRALFRPNVELELAEDAVKVLMKQWDPSEAKSDGDDSLKMPDQLVKFFSSFKPASDENLADRQLSMFWIVRCWQVDRVQQRKVQALVADIGRMYESAEKFWERRVKEAHHHAEVAQKQLEEAVKKENIKVVLCSCISDLEKVKSILGPDLMLKQDCKIGDSEKVPKGKCLVWSQGAVLEYFRTSTAPSDAKKAEIQKNLPSLYKGKDVRLLFSGLDFDKHYDDAQSALETLSMYLSKAKTAGEAFPGIKQILDDLS